jgi:hypothetical protein
MFLANIEDGPLVRFNGSHQLALVWHCNQQANVLWIHIFFFMSCSFYVVIIKLLLLLNYYYYYYYYYY